MTISLSNITVNEATRGIQIGTLSGGSNYTLYSSDIQIITLLMVTHYLSIPMHS